MADKSTQLILEALGRAVAEPDGVPLHGGKGSAGLFATTPPAKQAAQRCLYEGWLRVAPGAGKKSTELCTLTDKGLAFLLGQVSPRRVLEDLVRALEARQSQLNDLVASARQTHIALETLRTTADQVLKAVVSSDALSMPLLAQLHRWHESEHARDCPLPELFRRVQLSMPSLTIGQFHDALRCLHDAQQIYLHPWSGPLYEIPEPSCALLVGHEIAYYASPRMRNAECGPQNSESVPQPA